ncbi:MAG: site-2 protease family protein [Planctomycetaceae bacterium]|nr:site-2 protease family protein [Planctomycetaceae bacterium]
MATLTAAFVLAISLGSIQNILIVALGLGCVIFFHELGHFAVAKWCNVNVERFSIGFGPILLAWKWGETEYALSLIPFGGYVKMLGQDDVDPGQMTDAVIEEDPRSYIAKNVPQRMAIISAGVIMNVVTGLLFFAFAFKLGVEVSPPKLGHVEVGKPAWKAGLQEGDTLTRVNGRNVNSFKDVIISTVLSSSEFLEMEGVRSDGNTTFKLNVYPTKSGTRREIGVGPTRGLLLPGKEAFEAGYAIVPGSPMEKASPPLEPNDRIVAINDQEIGGFSELQSVLAKLRAEEITFQIERTIGDKKTEKVEIKVGTQTFRTLGLWMDIGQIEAIQEGSPAEKAGLKVGDKIVSIENLDVGKDLNPLTLPEYLADHYGQTVRIVVTREEPGSGAKQHELTVVPEDRPGWIQRPTSPNSPLAAPAIGVAFHIIPTVLKVTEGSAAEGKLFAGDQIENIELYLPEGSEPDDYSGEDDKLNISLDENNRNWCHAFWIMQSAKHRHVKLTIKSTDSEKKPRVIKLKPQHNSQWYLPIRGFATNPLLTEQKADSFSKAFSMGINHTRNSMTEISMTLQSLFTGNLSVTELHGPIGIAKVGYQVSQMGLAYLLQFLGFLSINLAVLNFLPIPVLDGGHMVFLIWEGITRRKPNEKVLIIATYIGMIFVLSLMVLVIYLDLFVHGV